MIDVECLSFDLQLRDPFTISRGTVDVQPTVIVRVRSEGLEGLGEATTNTYYGVSKERMLDAIRAVRPQLRDHILENPAELWLQLDPVLKECRFAQCALDCAIWDLYAKMNGQPLWQLWGFDAGDQRPPTCYTIGIAEPLEMVRKMQAMPNWPVYKIKLGADGGLPLVRELRQHTTATFRVDANCAWRADQVLELAAQLSELNVELIEQPLKAEEFAAMRSLKGRSPIPLMADESCQEEADVDRCLDSFDAINIKLVKCGGLTPARRMITRAKERGLKVMVGCMTESSIGIAPGVHLLPLLDYADLDGALLLANDIASGLTWQRGYCSLPTQKGLGVHLLQQHEHF
ncbi:MAG: dipeptide epimerase [Planctomycetales bacterium]|nr:dipeptide epimerase [Planctomycetales bacterium]